MANTNIAGYHQPGKKHGRDVEEVLDASNPEWEGENYLAGGHSQDDDLDHLSFTVVD
jgi:hypothetical protein